MPKSWEDLTADDKIEELRKDILKTMGAVNSLVSFRESATGELGNIRSELQKLEGRLVALEKKKD
jgi:hypothetical protein